MRPRRPPCRPYPPSHPTSFLLSGSRPYWSVQPAAPEQQERKRARPRRRRLRIPSRSPPLWLLASPGEIGGSGHTTLFGSWPARIGMSELVQLLLVRNQGLARVIAGPNRQRRKQCDPSRSRSGRTSRTISQPHNSSSPASQLPALTHIASAKADIHPGSESPCLSGACSSVRTRAKIGAASAAAPSLDLGPGTRLNWWSGLHWP